MELFHRILRTAVAGQASDVIMIGEMRDSISLTAAMSAADTGHLVLSKVHTANASQSVSRILDFFEAEEREQIRRKLANTLLVKQGQVSEREALSKASNPQALEMNFKGIFLDEGRRILN